MVACAGSVHSLGRMSGSETESPLQPLRERLGEINDLSRTASLLAWDERTMMPAAAMESRARVMATLASVRHRMFSADEVGEMIEAARSAVSGLPHDSVDAALVRVVSRDYEKA